MSEHVRCCFRLIYVSSKIMYIKIRWRKMLLITFIQTSFTSKVFFYFLAVHHNYDLVFLLFISNVSVIFSWCARLNRPSVCQFSNANPPSYCIVSCWLIYWLSGFSGVVDCGKDEVAAARISSAWCWEITTRPRAKAQSANLQSYVSSYTSRTTRIRATATWRC